MRNEVAHHDQILWWCIRAVTAQTIAARHDQSVYRRDIAIPEKSSLFFLTKYFTLHLCYLKTFTQSQTTYFLSNCPADAADSCCFRKGDRREVEHGTISVNVSIRPCNRLIIKNYRHKRTPSKLQFCSYCQVYCSCSGFSIHHFWIINTFMWPNICRCLIWKASEQKLVKSTLEVWFWSMITLVSRHH